MTLLNRRSQLYNLELNRERSRTGGYLGSDKGTAVERASSLNARRNKRRVQ